MFIGSSFKKQDDLQEVNSASEEFEQVNDSNLEEVPEESESYSTNDEYGTLDDFRTVTTDANGVQSVQIGNAAPIGGMLDNSEVGQEEEETVVQQEVASSNTAAKEQYLESLAYAYELNSIAPDHEVSFNMGLIEAYEAWDNELNKIYGLLREKLSAEEMAALKKDELAWIKFRDKQVGDADTAGAWTVKERRIMLTEERTLYLIDMYFDEPSTMKYVQLADETGNIREKPSIDSKVVFNGVMGDMFTYLQEKVNTADGRTWYKVEYSSGLIGYISHAVSNLTNETPKYVRIMEDGTKIRSYPSLDADIIDTRDKGSIFDYSNDQTYAADGRVWLRVDYGNEYAYISQKVGTMTRSWGFDEF